SQEVTNSEHGKDNLLETSIFQLDHIKTFHPKISIQLNITPDHLDRYDNNFGKYAAAKLRIMENQNENDWVIYHRDDPVIHKKIISMHKKKRIRILPFSSTKKLQQGAFVKDQTIILKMNQKEEILMPVHEIHMQGTHNLNNGLATALAARASEISNHVIRESMRTFEGVDHRLEKVRVLDGVTYINDSKGTNINAVWYALDSYEVPITLIIGGRDKGNDYSQLIDQIRHKVHTIIAIGEAQPLIEKQLKAVVPIFKKEDTMRHAVRTAQKSAKRGEIVLLSPACSSYDMYDNYIERGDDFKRIVNGL